MHEELREVSIDDIIKEAGLPPDTKWLGYAVYLPDSDEFVAKVKNTKDGIVRIYSDSPIDARLWKSVKRAIKEAEAITYKYEHVHVVNILDTGEQLVVMGNIEVLPQNK